MNEVIIDDIVITIIRKKIKNLYIKIKPQHTSEPCVQVSVPRKVSDSFVNTFINSKLEWIKKHRAKMAQQQLPVASNSFQYENGEYHYYQGKRYLLNVIYGCGVNKVVVDDFSSVLNLYVTSRGRLLLRKSVLQKWYKVQLDTQILQQIEKWQNIIGVNITGYNIRSMTSRWGSCNISKRWICINLELVKKPPECLQYIIVHELVHLLERGHNKRFYKFMDKFLPPWRDYDKKLTVL